MPGGYNFARSTGGGIAAATGAGLGNFTSKPRKAKCPDNQPAVERLEELLAKYSNQQSNFIFTIRKAIKSVAECKEPITTQKQAIGLKFVGPSLAKTIVPATSSSSSTSSNGKDDKRSNSVDSNDAFIGRGNRLGDGSSQVKTKSDRGEGKTASSSTTTTTSENAPKSRKRPNTGANFVSGRSTMVAPPPPPRKIQKTDSNPTTTTATTNILASSERTPKQKAYDSVKEEAEMIVFPPNGLWKILLIVDGREHRSKQVVSSCKQAGIPTEERHLPIGDMAWIAQCIIPKQKPIEIMIGTIIERKEVSDLASSLYGTRYSEQRLRLSQCGIPQVLFLVEGDITNVPNCPADTIKMAMMETRIQLGFQVVQTKHLADTVRTLKGLHRRIVQRTFPNAFWSSQKDNDQTNSSTSIESSARQENRIPSYVRDPDAAGKRRNGGRRVSSLLEMVFDSAPVPPFGADRFITYSELKAKVELDREQATRRIGNVAMAMLKQIPTLSEKKCTAIGAKYPTMNRLLEALCYEPCDDHEGTMKGPPKLRLATNPAKFIQTIPVGHNLTIGPKSASEAYTALCTLSDGALLLPNLPSTTATRNERSKKKSAKQVSSELKQPPTSRSLPSTSQLAGRDATEKPQKRQRPANSETTAQKANPDRKTLSSASAPTPPRQRSNDQDVIDLMSPDEKEPSKSKSFSYSHNADDSLLLSSPGSSHSSPHLSTLSAAQYRSKKSSPKTTNQSSKSTTTSTNKNRDTTRLLLDEDSSSDDGDDDDFDIPSISGKKKCSTSGEDRYRNDLDRAIRASLEGASSNQKVIFSESTTANKDSDTPNRKPAARKISNDSIVDTAKSAAAGTITGTAKKSTQHGFLDSDSNSSSSPGDLSLFSEDSHSVASKNQIENKSPGDLRSRVAQKLHREVIEIDSDSD